MNGCATDSQHVEEKEVVVNGEVAHKTISNGDSKGDMIHFKLPVSWYARPEEQPDLLILVWALVVYRGSGGSEGGKFTWTYCSPTNRDPSPVSRFMAVVTDIISKETDSISQTLAAVKSVRSSSHDVAVGPSGCGDYNMLFDYTDDGTSQLCNATEISVSEQYLSIRQSRMSPYSQQTSRLHAFADLLESILDNKSQTVFEAISVRGQELTQIWEWNRTVPPSIDICIHEIFEQKARADDSRPAVTAWDGGFSYGELDNFSTQLALRLIDLGVKIGEVIPLCFEKSKWTIVAVLAVMKAGGALALTDPSQPEARLQTIASEVNAKLVLTSKKQAELGSRVAPSAKVVVVGPEMLEKDELTTPSPLLPNVPASSTLYIIFTSGSTGKPKGVVISHSNYTSGALPRAAAVGYGPHSRVLDFPSYAFDVSIDCMLCTLAQGGCICVPSEEARINNLSGAIRDMSVNMAHMTPSVARVLDADIMPALEVLGLGGESVSASDASNWGRQTKIVIAYGPSECTVGCTINNDVKPDRPYSSIGKGVGGTTWIVDPADDNRLMSVGAVGELLVEGPVVGTGYLNDSEKTAEVFIEDPVWLLAGCEGVPGRHGRLYKTGDLVRYDPDGSGSIVFVGRGDQQVKLRGQRVELGEIEYNLRNVLPPGTSVVAEVITPGGKQGDATLVAFIAEKIEKKNGTEALISEELRQIFGEANKTLAATLPRYMIPAAYIPLREIPLLVSCKTDRKKLRSIGSSMSRQQLASLKVAFSEKQILYTKMEWKVSELWKRLFGEESDIGASDNFFDLGGDSLMAMKLVTIARGDGLSVTVADIFRYPVLSELAATVRPLDKEDQAEIPTFSMLSSNWEPGAARAETAKLSELDESVIEDVYPCTPLQEGLMALSAKISEAYVAQRVVELKDLETAQRLRQAFEVAAEDSPILRTRIVQVPRHGLMQIVVKGPIPWRLEEDSLEEYLKNDRSDAMGLGTSLSRFAIINETVTGKVHFVLTIHHALYDGWSMPLVVDRVNRAYRGLKTQRSAPFTAFIKHLKGGDRASSEKFWKEQLHGATAMQFPALPYPGYQTQAESLLEHYVPLPQRSASSTSLASAIRGAWALVAGQYTASDDVVFGETLTGRNAPIPGVEEIEGPMITTVPIRVRIDGKARVSEYLQGIHDQTVSRIPHEHIGLQHIRRLSADAREACELRTGLVIHPRADEETSTGETGPADGFVPAGDEDAAREALKFNSYALMLVFSLDPKGVLIMASFDSNTVDSSHMGTALQKLGRIVQLFSEEPGAPIEKIHDLGEQDLSEIWKMSRDGIKSLSNLEEHLPGNITQSAIATWIVDPSDTERLVPVGGVGELLVENTDELSTKPVDVPRWFGASHGSMHKHQTQLFRTDQLAKYRSDGSIILLGRKGENRRLAVEVVPSQSPKRQQPAMTEKQTMLQKIWSRVVGIDEGEISVNDSFFDLGGDSIGAMKLVSEARMEGYTLTVAQIFRHRRLYEMAGILQASQPSHTAVAQYSPFSVADVPNIEAFISDKVQPALEQRYGKVVDILPARPLQDVAIKGTTNLPRYSARYELFHLDADVDVNHLFNSCQKLIELNEILRTVFIEIEGRYFGVVLEHLSLPMVEYDVEGEVEAFAQNLCNVDIHSKMSLGSPFLKFFYIHGPRGKSCLILRISHAQYDEISLPILLRQLSSLYERRNIQKAIPFSPFVGHVIRRNIPESIEYWRGLLEGSSMTVMQPDTPVVSKQHAAVCRTFDISGRSKNITIATLPTAAWAICLARRLAIRDVTFGEVVSGRNIDFPNCDMVMGPCWQYVPVRVKFGNDWTVSDLLNFVQNQHIASTRFEGIGLNEIVKQCTDWPQTVDWFDSVVHQDVEHVESMAFLTAKSRMETIYPHAEPLREWKVQAFPKGDTLCIEIVTVESWKSHALSLLGDLESIMTQIVNEPGSRVFRSG